MKYFSNLPLQQAVLSGCNLWTYIRAFCLRSHVPSYVLSCRLSSSNYRATNAQADIDKADDSNHETFTAASHMACLLASMHLTPNGIEIDSVMAKRMNVDDQFKFLLSCVKWSNNGKV